MSLSEDNSVQRQAEDILLDSEERTRLILESTSEAICGCDSDGICLFSNPSAAQMLGYDDPAELIGKNLHALEHHTRKDGTPYPIEECPIYIGFQKNENVHRDDEVYWRKDGTSFPVEFWSHIVIREGKTLGAVITFIDITERKQAEATLRKSEERWRSVYENSAIGVALADPNGRFLAVNRAYEKMLGYTEEELRKFTFLEITEEDYRDSNWELVSELLDGKRQQFQIEKQYRRKDGALRWVSNNVSLVPGTESMPRFIMALSEDITERKQAEEALLKSERELRTTIEAIPAFVVSALPDGSVDFLSQSLADYTGFPKEQWLGWGWRDLVHPEDADRAVDIWRKAVASGEPLEVEVRHRRADGKYRWDLVRQVPLRDDKGNIVKWYGTLHDIEDQIQAEAALRKSEEKNRILLQINNAIITNLTQQALLHSISEALHPIISFDRCAITLYQPERDSFRFLAVEGELLSNYFHMGQEFTRNETCGSWVFDHQRPLVRRYLAKERHYPNEHRLAAEGIQSMCVVPLILQAKCIGLLSIVSQQRDRYSDEDAFFLQEVANQIALAVQNMQSYREIDSLKARLEKENIYLREELRAEHNFEEIVGNSPALLKALNAVEQVAPTNSTVLIYGETGTGKELVARAIHSRSSRNGRALVSVNCSAISAGLVESELFGHMKGAFTGALERRIGRFELANGGTIFLDEIGELSLETQVKLLRVLQEHEFEPVGSSHPLRVDVRVIAATNRNLGEAVRAGQFRSDLFYRLNVFPIELPPLRERRSDIPQLVAFCVSRFSKRFGKKIDGVSRESMDNLVNYPWPGNIRELQNVIERAMIVSAHPMLRLDRDLMPVAVGSKGVEAPEAEAPGDRQVDLKAPKQLLTLEEVERDHILNALQFANGVVDGPKGAAKILNLHPNTLRHRMDKLCIKASRHRQS
ncbi:MAG: sigma 54-interacting transcriptional regulator [Terracidiphilus sp.]|jgi:formate hydrogenlyase transcriptional activator